MNFSFAKYGRIPMYCAGLMVRLLLVVSKICPSCQTEVGVKIHADEFHSSLTEFPILFAFHFYRPQRSWGKVMFLQVCVILFTGGST